MKAVGLVEPGRLQLPDWYPDSLGLSLLLVAAFGLLRGSAYFLKSYLGGVIHHVFIRQQRSKILAYALANSDRVSSHEVFSVYSDRVTQAAGVLYGVSGLVLTVTSTCLLFLLGLKLAPIEMVLGILLLAAFLFPLRLLDSKIQATSREVVRESESASRYLVQGMRHHLFLKIYNLIQRETDLGKRSLERYEALYRRYYLVSSFKFSIPLTVGILVICLITYFSVAHIHTPAIRLVSFFYIFIRLAQGASDINSTAAEVRMQIPGFLQLFEWHERYSEHEARRASSPGQVNSETERLFSQAVLKNGIEIEVANLSFSYPGGAPLFEGLNFSVRKGETLVIQGESGVGKSTLLSLLLGLLVPTGGVIRVNGFGIEVVRPILSRFIGYVGPEPHLIVGSVRENLLYGHINAAAVSDEDLWAALQKARLEADIRSLPGQLDHSLFELTQLSTGQKQRLAIARAILRRPAWLVLDEASANLDAATEDGFVDSLAEMLPNLTTVVITHKPSFNRISTQQIQLKR